MSAPPSDTVNKDKEESSVTPTADNARESTSKAAPKDTEKEAAPVEAEGGADGDEEERISFDEADLPPAPEDSEGIIDEETFGQIREMDDPEEDEELFSAGIVVGFFEQAENTFGEMRDAIFKKDLPRLSSLGHFLKGSSAALGVTKVQAICETIQHNGKLRDEELDEEITEQDALKRIAELLRNAEIEYKVAKAWFLKLYPTDGSRPEE